jgi:hypothetical protein
MVIKLSMLSAACQPGVTDQESLTIRPSDATSAVMVATRWKRYALAVAQRVGENDLERTLERCLSYLRKQKPHQASRRDIARSAHVSKDLLDRVQATAEDRGQIRVSGGGDNRGPMTWELTNE